MLNKPSSCEGCALHKIGRGFCNPEGSGAIPLLIVGHQIGGEEVATGLPFRIWAQAGSILHSALRKAGYSADQFVLHNLVNCMPPTDLDGASFEHAAINHCRVYMDRVIERYRPKVILALGSVALKHLTGMSGPKRGVKELRGFFLPDVRGYGIPVIGTYHPAAIRRGETRLLPLLTMDIRKAAAMAKGELVEGRDYILDPLGHPSFDRYEEFPTLDRAEEFYRLVASRPDLALAFDIENPRVTEDEQKRIMVDQPITQIQFSVEPWTAIALPWDDRFKEVAAKILALPNRKVGWNNLHYDTKVLQRNGVRVEGPNEDLMYAAQALYSDLPKGLQSVSSWISLQPWPAGASPCAWKHLVGAAFQRYGCLDADISLRLDQSLIRELERRGHLETYRRHFIERNQIMLRVSERGIRIDRAAQTSFRESLNAEIAELNKTIQSLVPDELLLSTKKDGYKTKPKKLAKRVLELMAQSEDPESLWVQREFRSIIKEKCSSCQGVKGNKDCPLCFGKGKTERPGEMELRWCILAPFNGGSSDQVKKYIRFKGHPVPQHLKTKKETTGKDALNELFLKTGDLLYSKLMELRLLTKMRDTFVSENCDWNPGPDEKVHPIFQPMTGSHQWISRAPNAQNFPAHGKLAESFAKTIVASEGNMLVALDFSGFHTLTQAFEASDEDYLRLARLDMHSYIAARKLKLPGSEGWLSLPDEELEKLLKGVKRNYGDERSKSKSAVFGRQFGQSDRAFYERHKASFDPTDEEAFEWMERNKRSQIYDPINKKRLILVNHPPDRRLPLAKMVIGKARVRELFDQMDALFPKVYKEYPVRVRNQAQRFGFLDNPFGFRRYFGEVYRYNAKTQEQELGMDAEKVLAYLPSSNAHAIMGECHLEMERLGYLDKYRLIDMIHDSNVFDCPKEFVVECIKNVSEIMVRPSQTLKSTMCPEGLQVAVEVKVGKDLGSMKVVNLERLKNFERSK